MRSLALLLALVLAVPCYAQKNFLKGLTSKSGIKNVLSKNATSAVVAEKTRAQLLRQLNARVVQGKILPNATVVPPNCLSERERNLLLHIPNDFTIQTLLKQPTEEQRQQARNLYLEAMAKFRAFKEEADPFLYYQSQPNERRVLTSSERGEWSAKIANMHNQLERLKPYISPQDPIYRGAREYVTFAAEILSPFLRGTVLANTFERTDRKYDFEEFFLYTPKANREAIWNGVLTPVARAKKLAEKLPKGLKMAVLNDEYSVLRRMREMHEANRFFPGWELSYYRNTEEMLAAASADPTSFDVILTDIIVPGGGGNYLTGKLRERGFKGVIIALSAFQEDDEIGRKLFDIGFDGMIPQGLGFEMSDHWQLLIMKRLQNYFYYRDLHHWDR